jgi:hypothetical protein
MAMGHSVMPHTGCYNTFHARKVDSALCKPTVKQHLAAIRMLFD